MISDYYYNRSAKGVNLRQRKPHIAKVKEGWVVFRVWVGEEEKAIKCLNFTTRLNKGLRK